MKKILLALFLVFLLVPVFSVDAAGLVPCGNSDQGRCTLCHLISGIHGLIQWGGKILGIVAFFALVVSGVIYLVSAGDSSMMESAKNFMKSALIGTAIFLCAWLIIQTVFYVLGANLSGIAKSGNWFSFELSCPSGVDTSGDIQSEVDQNLIDTSGDSSYEKDQAPYVSEPDQSPY